VPSEVCRVHELFAVSLTLVLFREVCDLKSPSPAQSCLPPLFGLLALHSFVREIQLWSLPSPSQAEGAGLLSGYQRDVKGEFWLSSK
jgi:hypothetical protein